MAKKLFGGSGKGRYSGAKRPGLDQEPELDEALPQEAEQIMQEVAEQADPTPVSEQELSMLDFPEPADEEIEEVLSTVRKPEPPARESAPRKKKKKSGLKIAAWLLAILLLIECAYCVVIFTDLIPPIAKLRTIYIETAMSTMRHQWLAKALIPGDIVMEVVNNREQAKADQVGVVSGWEDVTQATEETKSPSSGFSKDAAASLLSNLAQDIGLSDESDDFFEEFYELDEESTRAYAEAHPEVVAEGWDKFLVNEAGLDDEGTSIYTTAGDQVLAIDAENGLIVVRVKGDTYKGVLVIGKDPSRLHCAPSSSWGAIGERVGQIAENNNGLVAMTGSGFGDGVGVAEGADQAGGAMCSGVPYGNHYPWGYKRIELHKDNRLYIVDAHTGYSADCTDATEWSPALIIDGVDVSGNDHTYTELNPRIALGQTRDEAILMLAIEGRNLDSIGCDASELASILMRYDGYQAMNLDGGTSAMLWYQGEYIFRCSNENLPEGRRLPNAWIYGAESVPDPA